MTKLCQNCFNNENQVLKEMKISETNNIISKFLQKQMVSGM